MNVLRLVVLNDITAFVHQIIKDSFVEIPKMLLDRISCADLEIGATNINQQFIVIGTHCIIPMSWMMSLTILVVSLFKSQHDLSYS